MDAIAAGAGFVVGLVAGLVAGKRRPGPPIVIVPLGDSNQLGTTTVYKSQETQIRWENQKGDNVFPPTITPTNGPTPYPTPTTSSRAASSGPLNPTSAVGHESNYTIKTGDGKVYFGHIIIK